PAGHFRAALEYAENARVVVEHSVRPLPAVVGEVSAQAVELGLRAFLISKLGAHEDKKVEGRHDLAPLWTVAHREGLPIDPVMPRWCAMLSAGHVRPYLFRYPRASTGISLPPLHEIIRETQTLMG